MSCLFNGLVYYDQWERLVWWQMIAVLLGIAVLVGGVLVISWQPGSFGGGASSHTLASTATDDAHKQGDTWSRTGTPAVNEQTPLLSST